MLRLCLCLAACLWATAPAFAAENLAASGDWLGWRGADRSGRSADTGLLKEWPAEGPRLVYHTEGFGSGYASVSLVGGRLYTTGNFEDGQAVVAANAADGSIVWKSPLTDAPPRHSYEGSRSTPTIDGDRLYVVASNGQIVCLSAADGSIVWRREFQKDWNGRLMSGWGFSESPLVDGPWVLCTPGGREAMIVALDKMTGEQIWASRAPTFADDDGKKGKDGAGYSSIVISHGGGVKQYVQLIGRGLIGVRASDGEQLWAYNAIANGTANIPTPIVDGDLVFGSTGYNDGASAAVRLSPASGGVKADEAYFIEKQVFQNHHGGMVLVDGHIYSGHRHGNGFPICVELATGEVKWGGDIRGAGGGSAAIVYADGHLVFRYQNGVVAWIEATPAEYRLKGSFKPAHQEGNSWAHPVVAGGLLYLREQNHLMVYDLRAGAE